MLGFGLWALDFGFRTLGFAFWALDFGLWTLGVGRTLDFIVPLLCSLFMSKNRSGHRRIGMFFKGFINVTFLLMPKSLASDISSIL